MIADLGTFVAYTLALIWCFSAAVCLEAQIEVFGRDRKRLPAIVMTALCPVVNTVVSVIYLMDKVKGRSWRSMGK